MKFKMAIIWAICLVGPNAAVATQEVSHPSRAQWMCIHKYEAPPWAGGWRANTGSGYYGGLQFDSTFELNYGRKYVRRRGHANNWPVRVQIAVANKGWARQGWAAWPTTSRKCGYR